MIHIEACLDSSSSRGDSLESAVPVRVGQHQLRPRPVAVHHHLPAPLGVELLVHQNPLYYPADINIAAKIQTYFGIAKTVHCTWWSWLQKARCNCIDYYQQLLASFAACFRI